MIQHLIFYDVTQFFILNPDTFALQRFPFNLFHLDGSGLQFLHSHPDHQDGLEQSTDRVLWVIHANFQWLVGNFNPGKWFLSKPPLSKHLHLPMLDGSLQFSLMKTTSSWGELLGNFSCTTTCFGAVIEQERSISILILHYIS